MLVEEVQDGLVSPFILLEHLGVLEVGPRRHPAVDLSREGLDVVGGLQVVLESLDGLGILILGGEHRHGDGDCLGVLGVDHGRVTLHGSLEDLVVLAGRERRDLTTPAESENGPVEAATGGQLVGFRDHSWNLEEVLRGTGLGLEEVAEFLFVFVGLRREPGDISRLSLEEVGHEDAVFLLVSGGQNIGTLDGLVEETENVCYMFSRIQSDVADQAYRRRRG